MGNSSGTDDTLIIGIVGGVVALIAIIVIVVCICRLRWSNRMEEARMAAGSIQDASMIRPGSAYSGKINHDLYISSYNGSTLDRGNAAAPPLPPSISTPPLQMMPFVQPMHLMHTLLTPNAQQQPPQSYQPSQQFYGYCDGSSMPLYVTCSADTKCDR